MALDARVNIFKPLCPGVVDLPEPLEPFVCKKMQVPATAALIQDVLKEKPVEKLTIGFLARWGSAWIGAHWSPHRKRLCINVIPFVTFWIVLKGGMRP